MPKIYKFLQALTMMAMHISAETKTAASKPISPAESPANPIIHSLTVEIDALQNSVNSWNKGYIVLLTVSVLVGAWLLYAQYRTISLSRALSDKQSRLDAEKDRQLVIDLSERDSRISQMNKDAASANEEAGRANKAAGEANERAGKLESENISRKKELAGEMHSLELEREKRLAMEERIAPRRLEGEDRDKFVSALRPITSLLFNPRLALNKPVVQISSVNDAEASEYTFAIWEALKEAGWDVGDDDLIGIVMITGMRAPRGVFISVSPKEKNSRFLLLLITAFEAIHVTPTVNTGFGDPPISEGHIVLTIGFKPTTAKTKAQ